MPQPPERGAPPSEAAAERPTLRHRVEYGLVRCVLGVARALPSGAAARLADAVGTLMRWVLPSRAKLARAQLAAALGRPSDDPEVAAWARQSFRHFMHLPLTLARAPRQIERGEIASLVRFADREQLDRALARGRGAILLTGHFGNWELFGLVAAPSGILSSVVARPLKNRLLDRELTRLRSCFGTKIVGKEGAGLRLARELKAGRCITLLNDQHAGSRGLRVPFFHADASTFTMAVALSRRFGSPIVPFFARVDGVQHIAVRFEAALVPDPTLSDEEDAYRLTLLFHRRLEAAIRADPGQYLWFHRRWKPSGQEPKPLWRQRYDRAPS
ncbi:MAG: hypothetical protein EXS13_00310 [Planctomycetes bacterium]|nr:hypothetical protein [Planctomycetota bacterium]